MKIKNVVLLFVLLISSIGMASPAGSATDVSLIQLVSNPEKYNGQPIRLVAFLHLEFEGNALYLHREDFEHRILANSIWIDVPDAELKKSSQINNRYVLAEGVFSTKEKGHFGMFVGSLQNVSRISPMPKSRN